MLQKAVLIIAAALPIAYAADVHIVEEIVAKVNGDIITRGEIEHNLKGMQEEARRQNVTGAQLAQAVKEMQQDGLRDQIDQLLLVQRAKDLSIKVDGDVTRRLAEIQVQAKITDPDKFRTYVREQTGMSYEDYRQQLTNQLLTQRVIADEISSRINIPENDLHKFYDEHKTEFVREEQVFLSQIVLSTEGKTPEQIAAIQKKATDLVARARKGEKFTDLARDNSDDVETARNGGEVGVRKRGEMPKQIEDLVFPLRRGSVTDPIKTSGGFLILKVDERFEPGQASFDEVKDQINQQLAVPKMQPRVREYLTRLRQDAFLEIKDGYVDTGAAPGKDTRWKEAAELKPQTTTKEEVAASRHKKFLKVIPIGKAKTSTGAAPAPAPPQ
jgi:parvulin-like peptidyl-prolyl isomerase